MRSINIHKYKTLYYLKPNLDHSDAETRFFRQRFSHLRVYIIRLCIVRTFSYVNRVIKQSLLLTFRHGFGLISNEAVMRKKNKLHILHMYVYGTWSVLQQKPYYIHNIGRILARGKVLTCFCTFLTFELSSLGRCKNCSRSFRTSSAIARSAILIPNHIITPWNLTPTHMK